MYEQTVVYVSVLAVALGYLFILCLFVHCRRPRIPQSSAYPLTRMASLPMTYSSPDHLRGAAGAVGQAKVQGDEGAEGAPRPHIGQESP